MCRLAPAQMDLLANDQISKAVGIRGNAYAVKSKSDRRGTDGIIGCGNRRPEPIQSCDHGNRIGGEGAIVEGQLKRSISRLPGA